MAGGKGWRDAINKKGRPGTVRLGRKDLDDAGHSSGRRYYLYPVQLGKTKSKLEVEL